MMWLSIYKKCYICTYKPFKAGSKNYLHGIFRPYICRKYGPFGT